MKAITLAVIFILFSAAAQAEESEGLVQKIYNKFTPKEKAVNKSPASNFQNTKPDKETVPAAAGKEHKDMSKAEMVQEIKDEVDSEEGILARMPELKKQKDKDGKIIYLYLAEGKQINIENADEKTARAILAQVDEKYNQIRFETAQEEQERRDQLNAIRHPAVSPPPMPVRPPALPPAVPRPPKR